MLIFCRFISKICKADIVKVFSFTAISTLVKMMTGLVSVKIVATIIGPSGIALLGQLNNFSTIILTIASGGINNGITKYVAEYKESNDKIKILLSTALKITLWCSLLTSLLMIIFHRFLSSYILLDVKYGYVFVFFGLTLLFYSLNMLLISILNGYKMFKQYVAVNITGSILGLLFTLTFVYTLGLKGALISAVTFQSIMFFVTLWMIRRLPWVSIVYFKESFDYDIAKKYFRYTLMTLVSAATVPVSQMILRGYVIAEISSIEAGWWEALNRISNMYLMIITTSFGVYYLPILSELKEKGKLRNEIIKAYKVIVPMLLIGFSLIYILRFFIIRVLLTPAFLPMEKLFFWQLLGDFFKISSWLLAFLMVAKSMTRSFVITEVLFSFMFVGLGFLFLNLNGVVGITQAYVINYLLYFVTMLVLFRKLIFN